MPSIRMQRQTTFAARLRWWRAHRRLSQLELSGRAGIRSGI